MTSAYDYNDQLMNRPEIALKAMVAAGKSDGITAKKASMTRAKNATCAFFSTFDAAIRSGFVMLDDDDYDEGLDVDPRVCLGDEDVYLATQPTESDDGSNHAFTAIQSVARPPIEIDDDFASWAMAAMANTHAARRKENAAAYKFNAASAEAKKRGRKDGPRGIVTTVRVSKACSQAAEASIEAWRQHGAGNQRAEAVWLRQPIGKPPSRRKRRRLASVRRARLKAYKKSVK